MKQLPCKLCRKNEPIPGHDVCESCVERLAIKMESGIDRFIALGQIREEHKFEVTVTCADCGIVLGTGYSDEPKDTTMNCPRRCDDGGPSEKWERV